MKHSISIRFAVIFIGLMALIFVGIWGANNWLLESFYVRDKVSALEMAYDEMDDLVIDAMKNGKSISDEFSGNDNLDSGEQTVGVQLLRELNDKYGIMTVIVDSINDNIIVSSARDANFMIDRARHYILGEGDSRNETIEKTDNYTVERTYDARTRSSALECWGYYSDNTTIFLMTAPLASISESVQLSNRFLMYESIVAMVVGSIIILLVSRTITSPILKLSEISERMSKLDFDAKYEGNAQDEIGVLGNSMNILSDKLKENIGELKSANNQLQKDIEQKEQIDEMRQDFIANVSHELKTPIALIQGYAEGLNEGMAEDPESRQYYCDVIVDEANKMNRLVRQLLNLTELESGNDQLTLERFDVVELIKGVLTSAQILIQQENAAIHFDVDGPVFVWADEFKIEEVVTNLLNNALNHLDGERIITIGIDQLDGEARVYVRNTGKQIPEEELPKIWDKFYKVDKSRTREYGGSGIGLSIVKAIMDSHNKDCGVFNADDGVEFWFTLDTRNEG